MSDDVVVELKVPEKNIDSLAVAHESIKYLRQRMVTLENDNDALINKVEELDDKVYSLENRIDELEDKIQSAADALG